MTDPIRIDATASRFWFALLRVTDKGVEAEIWKQLPAGPEGYMSALEGRCHYDGVPLSIVRPRILELINGLAPPFFIGGRPVGN